MKRSDLSPAMLKALQIANAGGSIRLWRWPGGFWMGRTRAAGVRAVIDEYASTKTVHALIERGFLKTIAHLSRGKPWIVEMTDKAKEALKEHAPNSDQNEIRTGRRAE